MRELLVFTPPHWPLGPEIAGSTTGGNGSSGWLEEGELK